MHTTPVCSHIIYPSVGVLDVFIGSVLILIDTSSGLHGKMFWLQLAHNAMLSLQLIFATLMGLSHLNCIRVSVVYVIFDF